MDPKIYILTLFGRVARRCFLVASLGISSLHGVQLGFDEAVPGLPATYLCRSLRHQLHTPRIYLVDIALEEGDQQR